MLVNISTVVILLYHLVGYCYLLILYSLIQILETEVPR